MYSYLLTVLALMMVDQTLGQAWNYHGLGPAVWGDFFPTCAQRSQSPITIKTACTVQQSFAPFQFAQAYRLPQALMVRNDGHTLVATYAGNDSSPLLLTGGGLNGTYRFFNLHLHWGENYRSGSEHRVNGRQWAGEAHFVHIQPETGKLAVLGMFIDSVPDGMVSDMASTYPPAYGTTEEWSRYFNTSQDLREVNTTVTRNFSLAALMGSYLTDFWRYEGSLTVPPCTEGITWTVFRAPLIVTESVLGSFRKNVYFEDYREPQPLYERVVQRSFQDEVPSSIPDFTYCAGSSSHLATNRVQATLFSFLVFLLFCTLF